MEGIPVLKAKLSIPELPDRLLYSGRIKKLDIAGHKAVIVTAPSGFGKTTAVLLSLKKYRDNIRWYRMEKEDSFLPVFYAHLIETLLAGGYRESEDLVDSARSLRSIGNISEEYPLLNASICQDAWAFYSGIKDPVYLVLDDFHNVADNAVVAESIRYFISNMPPNLRLIVMSRVDTGIPDGKLALRNDIHFIDGQALRFTKEEVEKLVTEIYKLRLNEGDVDRLYEYAEGWIAGITILSHTAVRGVSGMRGQLSFAEGNNQKLFGYFFREAFAGLEKDMVKTLAFMSVLPNFTCDDLKAVFGMENAAETISWLEKRNMFLQKIKAGATSYHFHSLFRTALQSILQELFTQAEITDMHLKAAYHYEKIGNFPLAIHFLISAGRADEAVGLAIDEGMRFMDTGDIDKVTPLVQEFDDRSIQDNPYLMLFKGASLMGVDYNQSNEILRRSFLGFSRRGNLEMQMNTFGLITSIAVQRNNLNEIEGIVSQLPKFKAVAFSKKARTSLLMGSYCNAAGSDKLRLGDFLLKIAGNTKEIEPLWDIALKTAKMMHLSRKGELRKAEALIPELLNHPVALTNDRLRTIGLVACHNVTQLTGDKENAQKISEELVSIGEKYNNDYALGFGLRLTACIRYQTRDIPGAVQFIERSAGIFARYGNTVMNCVDTVTKYF